MAQAPGARPQIDWDMTGNPRFRAFGQHGEGWSTLEGVAIQSPKAGTQGGNYTDYSSIEEASVQTLGNGADAITRGIQVATIVKSGGNAFHGGSYVSSTNSSLESENVDQELIDAGIRATNSLQYRYDVSGEVGGRLVRDKLWFYGSLRRRERALEVFNAFHDEGVPSEDVDHDGYGTIKVSYQVNPSTRLIGFYQKTHPGGTGGISQNADWDNRNINHWNINVSKLEGQWVGGNKYVSAQHGAWIWNLPRECFSNNPATNDQLLRFQTGCSPNYGINSFEDRYHTKATLTWYKPDWFAGNHDFKIGFDSSKGHGDRRISDRVARPEGSTGFPVNDIGNYRLVFRNGVPFTMEAWNNCYDEDLSPFIEGFGTECDPRTIFWYAGGYLQDSWTIGRRVTLNLGVRMAHDQGFIPPQCRSEAGSPLELAFPANCFDEVRFRPFNSVTPRLHVSWDVRGNGNTVIKGGWGMFAQLRTVESLVPANENTHLRSIYSRNDLNGDSLFNVGEIDFDPNGPDFLSASLYSGGENTLAGAVPNPDEPQVRNDEFSVSIEQQLMQDFALRVTGIYSKTSNIQTITNTLRPFDSYTVPVTNPDPGPDGRVGTGDDPGTSVTYFEYPLSLAGRAFQRPMIVNGGSDIDQTFKSFEVAASKRLSNLWQMNASYSVTKIDVPVVQNTAGAGQDFRNPGIGLFVGTDGPQREDLRESRDLGMDGQAHRLLCLSGGRPGVGRLRAPQRHAVRADGELQRRPDDSVDSAAGGTHQHQSVAEYQSPAHALPKGDYPARRTAGDGEDEYLQHAEHQCHRKHKHAVRQDLLET